MSTKQSNDTIPLDLIYRHAVESPTHAARRPSGIRAIVTGLFVIPNISVAREALLVAAAALEEAMSKQEPKWREYTGTDEIIQEGDEHIGDHRKQSYYAPAQWKEVDIEIGRRAHFFRTLRFRTKRPRPLAVNPEPSKPVADQIPQDLTNNQDFYQIAKDLAETASATIAMYKQGTPPPQLVLGLFNEACAAYDKAVENLLQNDSDSLS